MKYLSIKERFEVTHAMNPSIYEDLVRLTRELVLAGQSNFKIRRWKTMIKPSDKYKLNHDYLPYYARLIMAQESDLEGVFRLRELSR